MAQTFHIATLGCKINQYESHAIAEAWEAGGLMAAPAGDADLILVNSCAVTARAVRDLRQTVRRLQREAPEARIVVTGCAAELLRQELEAMPGVTLAAPQERKALLKDPALLLHPEEFMAAPLPDMFQLNISGFERARAVLKVQDGCSHRCTYCIVPLTRGKAQSRPFTAVLEEARRLLAAGIRELVISGVNLRQYRHEGKDFWDLLAFLDKELASEWRGRARLRLSSLEPGQFTDRGIEVLGAAKLICPHLHISLQSGSATVLTRMGRGHYPPQQLLEGVSSLRSRFPHFETMGLGADILTGFPQESEAEFQETVALVRALPLTYAHVFPFSRRPGTPAADYPGQVPQKEKAARAAILRNLVDEKRLGFLQKLAGLQRLEILVERLPEGKKPGKGRSEHYAPVLMQGALAKESLRRIVAARPSHMEEGALICTAAEIPPAP